MKTIIKAYHKNSDMVAYHKYELNNILCEYTFDENGYLLTYKDSSGYSCEYTYDENGNPLSYKTSDGYSSKITTDENGNKIAYKNSDGDYRVKGKQVTKEKYEAFIDLLNSKTLDGKEVEIKGTKYKLKLIK